MAWKWGGAVIVIVHGDHNSEESTEFGHRHTPLALPYSTFSASKSKACSGDPA